MDALVDTAGVAHSAARAVRDGGHIATTAGTFGQAAERGITIHQVSVSRYARDHANLDRLRRLTEEGRVTLRVARTQPAEQAGEAHRMMDAGGVRGRLVLTF